MITLLSEFDQGKQRSKQLEEAYERQFPKTGRDFVYIDDLIAWIDGVRLLLLPLGIDIGVIPLSNVRAKTQAMVYKEIIENGEDGSKRLTDIAVIDDPDEE